MLKKMLIKYTVICDARFLQFALFYSTDNKEYKLLSQYK